MKMCFSGGKKSFYDAKNWAQSHSPKHINLKLEIYTNI